MRKDSGSSLSSVKHLAQVDLFQDGIDGAPGRLKDTKTQGLLLVLLLDEMPPYGKGSV